MKPPVLFLLILLLLLFNACGQRGGLYLPDEAQQLSIDTSVVG